MEEVCVVTQDQGEMVAMLDIGLVEDGNEQAHEWDREVLRKERGGQQDVMIYEWSKTRPGNILQMFYQPPGRQRAELLMELVLTNRRLV